MKLISELKYRWLLFQWKRRSKKRRGANAFVGNLPLFFERLQAMDIPYVVLRWFDELPLASLEQESVYQGDIDVLVASEALEKFCYAVANCRGPLKLDLFSTGIRLGSDYKRMPYYPPVLGEELLRHRIRAKDGYWRPDPLFYLLSFAYHVVYHKGALSGLPSGLDWQNGTVAKHDYAAELRRIAAEAHETLPEQLTLLSLHEWLHARNWNMPFDLISRWPVRNQWHDELLKYETGQRMSELGTMHDILVFLIREDAAKAGAENTIIEKLGEKFTILDTVRLTPEQQDRVIRNTRGGDWTKHKSTMMVLPVTAVICHDPHPVPVDRGSKLGKVHFNVENQNVFYKHELRAVLDKMYPDAVNFMHGSDNDVESVAYVRAIYGDDWMSHAKGWHEKMS